VPRVPDQFVTWGSNLRLYRVLDQNEAAGSKTSEKELIGINRYSELLNSVSERYIKCVDVWRGDGVLLAVGQATGRVSLVLLSDVEGEFLSDREYNPRQSRPCTALAWHPNQNTLLAAGFEKIRTEHGIIVWELSQTKLSDKPTFEVGNGDHCTSLAWLHTQPCLVAGLGAKIIKIFDSRNNMKIVNQTLTKATYGLSVDPGSDYRISGYSETDPSVLIWDTRNFEKPIITLNFPHQVTKVSWCPTRHGLLANSVRDSGVIMLRDIMSWAVSQEFGEASVTERTILPPANQIGNIVDFSWHPTRENTLLAMGGQGRFAEWTVADRLTLNWSSRHGLVWSSGGSNLLNLEAGINNPGKQTPQDQVSGFADINDIGVEMQARAKRGYVGDLQIIGNITKYKLGSELETVWNWILQCRTAPTLEHLSSGYSKNKFFGVRSLLQLSLDTAQARQSSWSGLETPRTIRTYHSAEREFIRKLCGWDARRTNRKNLNDISRNAAIAVFSLDLKAAIDILAAGCALCKTKGELEMANNLNMVSVAVSGFSTEGSRLWRDVVSASVPLLPDPALKSLFSFLTADDEAYADVLDPKNLAFVDRIAFATKFLSDRLLSEYLEKEWDSLLEVGSLEGLLLSSSHINSLNIIQAYVDRTGDIQTASWISVYIFPLEILRTDKVGDWIQNYRTMLDQWNMFGERSELDVALTRSDPSWETQQQVFIACNYCGKSISGAGKNRSNKSSNTARQTVNISKPQACPSCLKPLPRCAVCLVNMGTMSGLPLVNDKPDPLARFGEWFTWCQTCRHGGHADHLLEWFESHSVCPVTGCACKCGSLDANSHVNLD